MPEDITQITAVGIIALFLIKEMFAFLKNRKNSDGNHTDFKLINFKLDNELAHIKEDITAIKERMYEVKRDIAEIKNKIR